MKNGKNNGYELLVAYFNANDWPIRVDEENRLVSGDYRGENATFRCDAWTNEGDDRVNFHVTFPSNASPQHRLAIAELCVRTSWGLPFGNFNIDIDEGEISFQTSALYPSGNLDDSVLHRLVVESLVLVDDYYPAFMSVLFGGATPRDAVLAAEKRLSESNET